MEVIGLQLQIIGKISKYQQNIELKNKHNIQNKQKKSEKD